MIRYKRSHRDGWQSHNLEFDGAEYVVKYQGLKYSSTVMDFENIDKKSRYFIGQWNTEALQAMLYMLFS